MQPIETTLVNNHPIDWYDLLDLTLEGRAFPAAECEHPYDRLPARARALVTDRVWELSRESAGIRGRFVTDARQLHARWWIRGPQNIMAHMPHSGQVGLDLYADDAGKPRYAGSCFNNSIGAGEMQGVFCGGMDGQSRAFTLYLPYRRSVGRVLVGTPAGSSMSPAPPATLKPLCYYGTSIVHGSAANRAGMTYPAITSRRLGRPFFNFGFGGNGPMHLEMAQILAELDAAVFIIAGCENMSPELVAERTEPFTQILRAKHPVTPILFIGNLLYAHGWLDAGAKAAVDGKNANLAAAVERIRGAGDRNVHLLAGPLIGDDGEATGDGVHPTDLGFWRMAEQVTPAIAKLLTPEA